MSLGFVNPALAWGLAAAALPILVHLLLRRRPREVTFPPFELLLRARRETERRLKVRRLLLLLARTLLVAAVALALARPQVERPEAAAATPAGPQATVLILDGSASMGYRLGGEPLFERARRDALEALAGLEGDAPAAALVCDGRSPQVGPPGWDRAAVRRALEEARPGALHADLTSCLAAATRALGEAKGQERLGKRIVVATDLTAAAWRLDGPPPVVAGAAGPVRPRVEVIDAARGAPLPNLAVTLLEAEPDPAVGPRGYRVTVAVASSDATSRTDVPLTLGLAGDPHPGLRALLDVPAGATARKQLSFSFPRGGPALLQAALPEDDLPVDDARLLALTVPREVRALVVDGAPSAQKLADEATFVESALASPASPVRPTLVDGAAFATADLAPFDVVLLLNVRSVGARAADLQAFVERGGGLLLALGDQVDAETYEKELGRLLPLQLHVVKDAAAGGAAGAARAARLATVASDHPALQVFTGEAGEGLSGARFARYWLTRPAPRGEAPTVLAAFDDGAPALVEARRGRGRVLLYTSTVDRDWTDWPIRTSFLPAIQRLTAWLSGALDERRDAPVPVGAERLVDAGEGRVVAALVGPDGRTRGLRELEADGARVEAGGRRATLRPLLPGGWQVQVRADGEERLDPALAFAVVPDPRESDTRRLDPAELTGWLGGEQLARVDGQGGAAPPGRAVPLWSWLLAAAVALFLAEGLLLR